MEQSLGCIFDILLCFFILWNSRDIHSESSQDGVLELVSEFIRTHLLTDERQTEQGSLSDLERFMLAIRAQIGD
jgi:hypothetical protein